ncbi:MAG: hypothetical protein E7163_00360 [Firmicutes bacterium]|nr:hypothetical protein [Bacillota bacterium]
MKTDEEFYIITKNTKIKDLKEIYTKIDSNNQVQLLDMHGNLIDRNQKNIYRLIKNIFNKMNIELNINNKTIIASFSTKSANKNSYGNNTSDAIGKKYKNEHIEELPLIIANSTYDSTKPERRDKLKGIHANTKEWNYFINNIVTEYGIIDINIKISFTGEKHYVYDVSYKLKKPSQQGTNP